MSVIFTVGYEGTDIDRFITTLKLVGIAQVADVRAVAVSRKKGFSKTRLQEHLAVAGIAYQHFVALGDPKPGREAARAGRYDEFRRIYNEHLSGETAQAELRRLTSYVSDRATALLCFERAPKECHRSIVADSLKACIGFQVFDLFANEPKQYELHARRVPTFRPAAIAAH